MIQIYIFGENNESRKCQRFFKERRIPFQLVDLRKAKIGLRELQLFSRAFGAKSLISTDTRAKSHPVSYTDNEETILQYLMENPALCRLPFVRDGQKCALGADENAFQAWIKNT